MKTTALVPDVFMSVPGSVMVFAKPMASGFFAYMFGNNTARDVFSTGTSYDFTRCILTSISINESANYQFLTTLRNFTYLYSFGDKISSIDVSGIAFLNPECDGVSGIHSAYNFYSRNKVSNNLNPITFSLVSFSAAGRMVKTFKCFLVSGSVAITDPNSMVGNFAFRMFYMPGSEYI